MKNRHLDFFEALDIDRLLAQEDEAIEEIHTTVEEAGTDISEEQLLWEYFRKSKE